MRDSVWECLWSDLGQASKGRREGLVASPPVNPHPVGRFGDLSLGWLYTDCIEDIDGLPTLAT